MDKRKIIIDTDCGSDDAMAIAMALNEPSVEILMFSTVHGNVSVEQAAINTLTTIEKAGSYRPPVYIGCGEPLLRKSAFAFETHGDDGMGDLGFVPEKLTVAEGSGIIKMIEMLENSEPGEIEIVAIGPLTNLALAVRMVPETMKKVHRISLMGTAGLGQGNVTPLAEFNIWQDAEAAKIVFEFPVPKFIVGWDACLGDAMLQEEDIARIREGSALGQFAIDCNRQLIELNRERFGHDVLDMADPAALAAVLYPDCIETSGEYYCEVDDSAGVGYGNVLIYNCEEWKKEANAVVCSALKGAAFKEYLYKRLCLNREIEGGH